MADPYIGEIRMFGFNYAPQGWAFCDGSQLPYNQYQPLFIIIGTTYGGDGRTYFNVPDLRGLVPIGYGAGPGLTPYQMAAKGGVANVTLTWDQLPIHNHGMVAENVPTGTSSTPGQQFPAIHKDTNSGKVYKVNPTYNAAFNQAALSPTGGGGSHENRQPFQTYNFCIALTGIFPSPN